MAVAPTLRRISEQVALLLTGGAMQEGYQDLFERAKLHVVDQINYMLKIEQYDLRNVSENQGSIDAALAYYTIQDASITVDGDYAVFNLPIRPMSLPHGQGVHSVVMKNTASGKTGEMIPIPASMWTNFVVAYPAYNTKKKFATEFSDTMWGYYTHKSGSEIRLSSKAFANGYTADIQLVVFDVSTIDEDDMLPVPADMVNPIIDAVVAQLSKGRTPQDETANQTPNN